MVALLREERADAGKEAAQAAIGEWILHDLRRTAATGMARLNIAPHVVDRILNHVSGTICGAAAVYNRHAYTEERKMVQRSARWPSMCGAGISRVLFAQRRRMLSRRTRF
jgi:hypothetical protein